MIKTVILIDGGHTRALSKQANRDYTPDFIEQIARSCTIEEERLHRIFYYDCAPFVGDARLPVSGAIHNFRGDDFWLKQLAQKDLFAVRRGILKFRGFKPPKRPPEGRELQDHDFKPDFEQKGVDMRIGLDLATFVQTGSVDRVILISGDTDCVPALKHARIGGIQTCMIEFENSNLSTELKEHCDFVRRVNWPE